MQPPEFCFLWINHWSTCMAKSEWASWLQAVFSVIAIAAATAIAARQNRHAMTLQAVMRREEGLRQLDIVIALADRAVWLLQKVPDPEMGDEGFEEFWRTVSIRDLEFAAEDLRKLGPDHVPRGSVLTQVTSLAHLLEAAVAIIKGRVYASAGMRATQRDVWNRVAAPIGGMRSLAFANRAVLCSIRENF